jgi:hypothetical protein
MSGPNPNAYACPYKNTDRKTIIFMHFQKGLIKIYYNERFSAAPEYSGEEGNLRRKVGEIEPKRKIEILLLTCLLIGENGFVKIDR